MTGGKALIGMSGGVDSSVSALLTIREGLECIGATMQLFDRNVFEIGQNGVCCASDDAEDARSVATRMGIPHYTFSFQKEFQERVIDPFAAAYERGDTPNPCITCNRFLKFGALMQKALELGCDYVVTGHYAQLRQDPQTGRYLLYKAVDKAKDQTYFLYPLTQAQLAHIRFPLGALTKEQVRSLAAEHGFVTASKRDSQDICFVPDGDYFAFLERYAGRHYPSGDFLDRSGNVVGTHRGAVGYTIGQRKGLGLAMGTPVYVCAKDMQKNTVTVGPDTALYSQGLLAKDWFWFPFPALTRPLAVTAKIRHSQFEQPATVYPMHDGLAKVIFQQPQRAVTPGQAVVLYQGDLVIGGGTITQPLPVSADP